MNPDTILTEHPQCFVEHGKHFVQLGIIFKDLSRIMSQWICLDEERREAQDGETRETGTYWIAIITYYRNDLF